MELDIRVCGSDPDWYLAEIIQPEYIGERLIDNDSDKYVSVINRQHAQNLIKGLQKAIELGWLD